MLSAKPGINVIGCTATRRCDSFVHRYNLITMKEVYFKGQPYQYKISESGGKRHFQLFQDGMLKHSIEQGELDIRSIVSFILDSYYRNTPSAGVMLKKV